MGKSILIGCDNAATNLKKTISAFLAAQGCEVEDIGCEGPGDLTLYPEIARRLCEKMQVENFARRGILLCGTGLGMCMTANKFRGVRAAVCHDAYSAERSILSNDANLLCMGERVVGPELAKKIVGEWISLTFQDGSSTEKVEAIKRIEGETMK
ncbi:MAG: ribose 5-phosphate isomerase B [Christensenellaceae bacterium]|jgi:ribose 5-phosphate isomerase B|nr:ribose 5-phosphate isomerase B [Christensenellaceae bacterium]